MTRLLRAGALLIAIAGIVDPAVATRRKSPLPVDVRLPPAGDPTLDEAVRTRAELFAALGDAADDRSGESPRAIIAIGNAVPEGVASVPVFTVAAGRGPRLTAVAVSSSDTVVGQKQLISVRFQGHGLRGRTSELTLTRGASHVAGSTHRWMQDDEPFEARFEVVAPAPGLDVWQLAASTEDTSGVRVDIPIRVGARKLRVFVYEPRPSWPAGFVRQALEGDAVFDVSATARTSRAVATETARAPRSLAALDHDSIDAIVVGGLEGLTDSELAVLGRFASARGGSVVLLPDGPIPEHVRAALDLPAFEELLLERPVEVRSDSVRFRASELLLPRGGVRYGTVATVTLGAVSRPAVMSFAHGEGDVVVSGVLDAWRYRSEQAGGFVPFWRGLLADAALRAVPPLAVEIEPRVARPGQRVAIRARFRETEWTRTPGAIGFPPVSASLVTGRTDEMVRMWPAAAPGVYEARITAPVAGAYAVRVRSGRSTVEAPLVVAPAAAHVSPDHSADWRRLANASGGQMFEAQETQQLAARLRGIDAPLVEHRSRPMRSAWWIVPFAGLLTIEWAMRRRKGQR